MKTHILTTGLLLMLLSLTTMAQERDSRFSFEISAGPAYSFGDLGGSDVKLGGGFECIFHYDLMPHTGIYTGWGWNHFSSDDSFLNEETGFEETGYVIGLQYKRPLHGSGMKYYIRGGALFNHLEIENEAGDIVADTGHGWGWQLATGVDIPMGKNWHFIPGWKFNSLSRTLDYEQTKTNLDLDYVSFRVGFMKEF